MTMTNTSALIVPPPPPAVTNSAAAPLFQDAPKPLIYIPDGWKWFFWGLVILALVTAAWLIWRWWNKKKDIPPAPIPSHVRARRRLEEALALLSEPKPFSTAVSGAIREYLEERFNFHAPDRTSEEFLYELQGTDLLTLDQKKSLEEFLASCDLIKFAKYEPTENELRALHDAALRLVNETEPRLVPENIQSTIAPPPSDVPPPPSDAPPIITP
jgi:hypothetical protein